MLLACAIILWPISTLSYAFAQEIISPIPQSIELDSDKVNLGEKLFHDPVLSGNGKVSCASCHNLQKGGTDNLPVSLGVSGKPGAANSLSVFNVGNHFNFFWDGRSHTLEEQIDGPINHPDEMASSWNEVIQKLNEDPSYKKLFFKTYNSPPTEKAVKDAIAHFEHSLITPNSPFDKFLRGDQNAISSLAKGGYDLFKNYGCIACHQGQNLGGNMFQKFGVMGNYFEDRGTPIQKADLGRYNVTNEEWDKHVFKVPSLRNIALTAPYFHDGSAQTLSEAIDIMATYQLGTTLTDKEKNALIAFLNSLTGQYKGKSLEKHSDQ